MFIHLNEDCIFQLKIEEIYNFKIPTPVGLGFPEQYRAAMVVSAPENIIIDLIQCGGFNPNKSIYAYIERCGKKNMIELCFNGVNKTEKNDNKVFIAYKIYQYEDDLNDLINLINRKKKLQKLNLL